MLQAMTLYVRAEDEISRLGNIEADDTRMTEVRMRGAAAAYRLSHMYRPSSVLEGGNPPESMRHLRIAALGNHPAATAELARRLELGEWVAKDLPSAARAYLRAAELGSPGAALAVARLALSGEAASVIPQDAVRARQLLEGIATGTLFASSIPTAESVAVESMFELSRLYSSESDGLLDPARARHWRNEADHAWRRLCARVIRRIWLVLCGGDTGLRTEYGMRSFLDRLQDQLRQHLSETRSRFAQTARANIPNHPLTPPRSPTEDDISIASKQLQGPVTDKVLGSWASGNVDEEADVENDPSGNVASVLAAVLQECITVAFPGLTGTADLADSLVALWVSLGGDTERTEVPLDALPAALQENLVVQFLANAANSTVPPAGSAAIGADGLDSELQAVGDAVSGAFARAWRVSRGRLNAAISTAARPLVSGCEKEIRLWTRRHQWATDLADECSRRVSACIDRGVPASLVLSARVSSARSFSPLPEAERVPVSSVNDISPLNVVNLSKLPFVWEGASVAMSSQLLDEVTGSTAKSLLDWNPDLSRRVTLTPIAVRIDKCLDDGLVAYSNPAASPGKPAMSHWQEARALAESAGDLIREASALCNIGGASHLVNVELHSLANDPVWLRSSPIALQNTDWSLAEGPAVVVWFMRLLVSLGHGNLAFGRVDLAGEWYDGCINLCRLTLQRVPISVLPETTLSRRTSGGRPRSVRTFRSSGLTYIQRTTVLLLVRAYTHRGLCWATLGDTEEAVRCQTRALELLSVHGSAIGETETTYRAAVEANLGNIYHTSGRLAAAVSHHARSAMLFLQVEDLQAQARELANLGALWLEIGKTLRSLEWVRASDPVISAALGATSDDEDDSDEVSDSGGPVSEGESKGKSRVAPSRRVQMRPLTSADVAKHPGAVYRVARAHRRSSSSDLDINLEVGEAVTIVMLMEDGVSALGQKEGDWQGTFPLSCIDVEDESGAGSVFDYSQGSDPSYDSYAELLSKVSELISIRTTGGNVPTVRVAAGDDHIHCGAPYIEFGLGLLRDVISLGCETAEVTINIAAGEVLLNQPFRAIRHLNGLVTGSFAAEGIPHSLRKHVGLTLSAAFLMIALANEDPTRQLQYWPDGSPRFVDAHLVDSRLLNNLLSSIGVSNASVDLAKLSRSDVVPVLQCCLSLSGATAIVGGGELLADYLSGPVGPLDAMVAAILGTLEWITGIWVEEVDPDDAKQWKEAGTRRVEEAIEKQAFTVNLFGEGEGVGIDGRRLGGDAGVFTVAAGLPVMEYDRRRQLRRLKQRSATVSAPPGEARTARPSATASRALELQDAPSSDDLDHPSATDGPLGSGPASSGVGSGAPDMLVWSWAVNSTRLEVCSRCGPRAMRLAVHGPRVRDDDGGVAQSLMSDIPSVEEPFPCPHNRGLEEAVEAMADLVLGETHAAAVTGGRSSKDVKGAGADRLRGRRAMAPIPEGVVVVGGANLEAGDGGGGDDDDAVPAYMERDPLALAADEVRGAMVRRATSGRLRDLEKARRAGRKPGGGVGGGVLPRDRKPALARRLEEERPPAWMESTVKELAGAVAAAAAGGAGGLLPAEAFVAALKRVTAEQQALASVAGPHLPGAAAAVAGAGGPGGGGTGGAAVATAPPSKTKLWFRGAGVAGRDASWVNLFYRDATRAMQNSQVSDVLP
ncbi:hypothetical protein HK405_005963 [Cladochytrium tenue]|nr:hypothetical protein HK405_005963 [Cladochytrium tenue]